MLIDNSDKVFAELERKIELAMMAVGEEAESIAKGGCPVDTGRLRASITYITNEHTHAQNNFKPMDSIAYSRPPKGTEHVEKPGPRQSYLRREHGLLRAL